MSAVLARAIFRAPESEPGDAGWWSFDSPVESRAAATPDELPKLLERVEEACAAGLWAAGFVSYEAAPAFDAALRARSPRVTPVAAFAFFAAPRALRLVRDESALAEVERPSPAIGAAGHAAAVATIRAAIAAGETYQVNLTFPVTARLRGEAEDLFRRLAPASGAGGAAFLDLGDAAIVSLSPELFFELAGDRITMRPMKGTRRRGRFAAEDSVLARELRESVKDRAENLMIVDMARNDLGRIAFPGSVEVTSLCELERYPTVWQLTSTVAARTTAGLGPIFAALFPCASVTGAPKPAATRFIADLETSPRGVYCGAIGWVAPTAQRRARFAVAIRTATIDRASRALTYGVGSGIVWDSDPAAEYEECLVKATALDDPGPPSGLIETIYWSPAHGARALERHLARLAESAAFWGMPCDDARLRATLAAELSALPATAHRIRLELDAAGGLAVACRPFERGARRWRAVLAPTPVSSASALLFHKTTRREIYERALAQAKSTGADEAILWNERGELTEGSRTNLLLRLDGRWLTPRRECGLLAGVLRARLLERGRVREATLTAADLARAERVLAASSLRGLIRLELG